MAMLLNIIKNTTFFRVSLFLACGQSAAAVILAVFVLMPEYKRQDSIRMDIENLRKSTVNVLMIKEFSKNYKDINARIDYYNDRLLSAHTQSELTEWLYNLAIKYSIKIISETNHKGRVKNNVRSLVQQIELEGEYTKLRRYLFAIDNLKSLSLLRDISIRRKKQGRFVKVSMKLVTYRYGNTNIKSH